MGLDTVILTCHERNIASQRVIENNGGEIIKTLENEEGKTYYVYEIRL